MNLRSFQYRTRSLNSCVVFLFVASFVHFFFVCVHRLVHGLCCCPFCAARAHDRRMFMPYLCWYEMRSCGFRRLPLLITLLITFHREMLTLHSTVHTPRTGPEHRTTAIERTKAYTPALIARKEYIIDMIIYWEQRKLTERTAHSYLHILATWVCSAYYYTFNTSEKEMKRWKNATNATTATELKTHWKLSDSAHLLCVCVRTRARKEMESEKNAIQNEMRKK